MYKSLLSGQYIINYEGREGSWNRPLCSGQIATKGLQTTTYLPPN